MKGRKFSEKHGPAASVDAVVKDKVLAKAKSGELPCAVAFKIAGELNIAPGEVGKAVDLLDFKLVKCQLGLFGYKPNKKIVTPKSPENSDMEKAIRQGLEDQMLSCRKAWEIAHQFQIPKMSVSAGCEALGVKIKPCQLGAF
jgi:hypothetical protein